MWLARADGGPPAPFTSDDVSAAARWSPDGRTLAIVRVTNGVSQIAFVGITRDERPPARIDFTAAGFAPAASQRRSDVRTIGDERYESNGVGYTYDTHHHIWIMDASGAHERALSAAAGREDGAIVWSFDDAHIAYSSSVVAAPKAFTSDLFTVDPSGGTPSSVASPSEANVPAAFLRNGRLLSFAKNVEDSASYPSLVSSDLSGGERTTIVPADRTLFGDWLLADLKMPGATCGPLVMRGDASLVTNASAPGATRLVRVDLASGATTPLTPAGEASDCTVNAHENHDLNRVGAPIHRIERLQILEDWLAPYLHP